MCWLWRGSLFDSGRKTYVYAGSLRRQSLLDAGYPEAALRLHLHQRRPRALPAAVAVPPWAEACQVGRRRSGPRSEQATLCLSPACYGAATAPKVSSATAGLN
mmetsp:Transcript_32293/g.57897  ORF Transcript_32293/g.57897 Transcript_32293/m.57897 type:complete len:103 (+) Transcript_32293:547-855(+)